MDLLYKKYVTEKLDENGLLAGVDFHVPDNFNFAFDVVDELGTNKPDRRAMYWVSLDKSVKRTFSFADMMHYSSQAANYFKSLGIGKGDKVLLVLKRHYQFWFCILALHKLGAVAVPATDQLQPKDYVYRFNKAGIKAAVVTSVGESTKHVDAAMSECPTVEVKVSVGEKLEGWNHFDSEFATFPDTFDRSACTTTKDDPMLMYFTSGTTGYPKIAAHSFSYPVGHVVTAKWWQNVNPDGLHFTISDTGWAKSMWGKLYGQWLCEAGVFTYDFDRFDPADMLTVMSEAKITTFCAPPTIFRFFIKEDLSKYDLSSLEYAVIAGEALNPEVFNQFYKATGLKLMEGYGQTEMTLVVINSVGMEPHPGSMGKPNPMFNLAVVTPEGKECRPGEVGELVLRTKDGVPPGMFQGYYNDEQLTKEAWHNDIYHTGDTVWVDENGYFWYVGRTDDLIKSSGYRIGPFEIESVIMELPSVLECAVTGTPDPVRGQVVKATIVLAQGYKASEELRKEIQNYVKEHTAPYKYPRVVEFVAELPKTISGKIRRVEIRGDEEK